MNKAEEMYQLAIKSQYENIMERIKDLSSQGFFTGGFISDAWTAETFNQLEADGFDVSSVDDEGMRWVSWSNK